MKNVLTTSRLYSVSLSDIFSYLIKSFRAVFLSAKDRDG